MWTEPGDRMADSRVFVDKGLRYQKQAVLLYTHNVTVLVAPIYFPVCPS